MVSNRHKLNESGLFGLQVRNGNPNPSGLNKEINILVYITRKSRMGLMLNRIESNAHMMSQVLPPSLGLAYLCLITDSISSQRGKVVPSIPNLYHSA